MKGKLFNASGLCMIVNSFYEVWVERRTYNMQ